MKSLSKVLSLAAAVALVATLPSVAAWAPARGPLMTRWAKDVSPDRVHPEYPRPQFVRSDWLNLNGLWDYALTPTNATRPGQWDGQILVPFPVESALSGVMKTVGAANRLWYRRTFEVPSSWAGRNVRLNFGAVDWRAEVWVNGQRCGDHAGGYDAFSFDISDALKPGANQEILVAVWDPSDAGTQPRGKQVARPEGIWYTPTTGIWQTVWLEPVAASHLEDLTLKSNIEAGEVQVGLNLRVSSEVQCRVSVLQGESVVAESTATTKDATHAMTLKVPNARLWSPDDPFLYDLRVTLTEGGRVVDEVRSYVGLRKIEVAKDPKGVLRLFLNGKALFQYGPLDQGFWPDGLYTAPTDEALRYDIEMTKQLGFNMARKHVKVEPDRWYYWCDKLGLLVWQDMPSGDRYIGSRDPDITRSPESGAQFEKELRRLIEGLFNHPSIVMWVPYNEGWGQWDTARIVELIRGWDPTRLVNNTSGWTDRGVGDVNDIHVYPGPGAPDLEAKRAGVLGEFGGLGLPVKGHTWQDERNWGYRSFTSSDDLTDAYLGLIRRLHPLTGRQGLSAAVYTQTTDVEVEVNGLMTYDRAMVKMDQALIAAANRSLYAPPADRVSVSTNLVPPATPLVACDPYFSVWSPADRLTDEDTVHWTGRPHRLTSVLRIDGKGYRLLGPSPATLPALEQKSLEVLPTRTLVRFEGAGVAVTLTFLTPAIPEDIDLLSRPVTYLTCDAKSVDGKAHEIQWYLDASGELTVNNGNQEVVRHAPVGDFGDLEVVSAGSQQQPVLAKKGDDLRIDWGYLYLAAPRSAGAGKGYGDRSPLLRSFVANGRLPDDANAAGDARAQRGDQVTLVTTVSFGSVADKKVSRWMLLAYDDLYSIQYMKKNLRPYWRRNGWEAADLLKASASDYEKLTKRCRELDEELMKDLRKAGGEKYARVAALAYRQCFAAGKFVADANGQPLQFSKENHSNGCIGTSDVFYPMAPQFLLLGPTLAKSFLVPFMNYAASERWTFPFAPHDLGTYPQANGQVYGGGERTEENQMPVEESGNLLILMAAVAQMEGHAGFAGLYWPQLEKWAEYLKAKGFDPENQLCTDDFAGHLAHNVNLSAKAICGLGAFAKLCEWRGNQAKAQEYFKLARGFAERWVKEAADGEKFRLAFDKPGTWSQKYNLVWDRILGLKLFPASVLRTEMDYYKKIQNTYGLPLDNRETYTKLDWILWTATLTRDRGDFEALVDPVFRFLNETPDRSPMTDWYQTKSGRKVGFTARPVVGGVFLEMLYHRDVWKKYAKRDRTKGTEWAPMPKAPKITVVVPTAREGKVSWRYTLERPERGWNEAAFDDSAWREGAAGFGTRGTPGSVIGTEWSTRDIHLRRIFELPAGTTTDGLQLFIHHDEDAQVFLNGQKIAELPGYTSEYETVPLPADAVKALVPGKNLLAIRCRQTGGGQYIDAGLVTVEEVR
ncbi:MAG: DUF4965 domain-containing protein [Verrucomicrobiales bacterium]|nr:DUF4965 domain-containing protein [Verrucomicrobiales bacterium]